jgi:hypothetical protein
VDDLRVTVLLKREVIVGRLLRILVYKEIYMKTQKKWSKLMISGLLILVLAVGGTAVFAQSQDQADDTPPTEESEDTSTAVPNPFSRGERGSRPDSDRRADGVSSDEYLAEALGITVEELDTAQAAAQAAALEQAVADGQITQEQADQMSGFGGRAMRGGHFGAFGDTDELLAEELGISIEALEAAQAEAQAAKTAQLVEDGVLTQEQVDLMAARRAVQSHLDVDGLNAAMQEAYETAVNAALEAGEITQEQADQLLSDAAAAPGIGGMFDGRGGHGHSGGRGMMPGSTGTTTDTADSNA